jgi:hypothetical protein
MKKYLSKKLLLPLFIVVMAGSFNSLQAQRLVFLFGHFVYSSPTGGSFKDNYKYGAGAEAGVGVGLLSKTFFTGTLGYSSFRHSSSNPTGNISFVPIKAGLRHYLFARMLFIHGDLGVGIINNKNADNSSTKFSGDLGVGVKLAGLEVLADYDGFVGSPSGSWIGLKAGFSFGL